MVSSLWGLTLSLNILNISSILLHTPYFALVRVCIKCRPSLSSQFLLWVLFCMTYFIAVLPSQIFLILCICLWHFNHILAVLIRVCLLWVPCLLLCFLFLTLGPVIVNHCPCCFNDCRHGCLCHFLYYDIFAL